jgi:acyl-[acyl carrier protein]--UDP-N-acetylglucosamine O-acyltransferase
MCFIWYPYEFITIFFSTVKALLKCTVTTVNMVHNFVAVAKNCCNFVSGVEQVHSDVLNYWKLSKMEQAPNP